MALMQIHYFSQALVKMSGMIVAQPDTTGPFRVVYLLHGLSDDYTVWHRRTSIERYADETGLMIVMPDGGRGFYCDQPYGAYEAHILETVAYIDRTFRTIDDPGARGIGGLSMGGYGAMKLGLKYPERFGSVVSHSGAVDLVNLQDRDIMQQIFFAPVREDDDCFALAARPGRKPALRFDCGTEDFLLEGNRAFRDHLVRLGVPHAYVEFPGGHTWDYWDVHVREALAFHLAHMTAVAP